MYSSRCKGIETQRAETPECWNLGFKQDVVIADNSGHIFRQVSCICSRQLFHVAINVCEYCISRPAFQGFCKSDRDSSGTVNKSELLPNTMCDFVAGSGSVGFV